MICYVSGCFALDVQILAAISLGGDSLVWAFYATLGATFGTSLGCRSMSSTSTYEASFHRVYEEACM